MKEEPLNKALFSACESGDVNLAQILLAHGADPNVKADYGNTLLHWTCIVGHPELVELLLAHGAEVNVKNKADSAPLHVACTLGHIDIARLLLEHGADVEARDNNNHTPFEVGMKYNALSSVREEILDLFRQYAPEAVMQAYCTKTNGPGGM